MYRESITQQLRIYEDTNELEILFAVESGSRGWGFHSPDSDYDVRFVYKRPLSWYMSILDRRDVFEPSCDHPLDINGWDIRKALYQIYKGNPAFFEWLSSPISYRDSGYKLKLKALAAKYFNPRSAIYHYLHMAEGNYRSYLKGDQVLLKKYLYVIRPIMACSYINEHHAMPPVDFNDLLYSLNTSEMPCQEITDLVAKKKLGLELQLGARIDTLNSWLDERIKFFAVKARLVQKVEVMPDDLNEAFLDIVTI